jgi:hypothetical protein
MVLLNRSQFFINNKTLKRDHFLFCRHVFQSIDSY